MRLYRFPMKKLLALLTAFVFLSSGLAAAHQPVVLLNSDTTAAKGPLLVDGTVSFAVRAAFNKAGEKKAFRAQLKEGDALEVQYLIVDKKPENALKNSQLPSVVITGPGGFKMTMKINERTKFYEPYGGTNYFYLARYSAPAKAGIYNFLITGKAKSEITLAVGRQEIKGEVVRGPYVAPTPTPTLTPTPTPVIAYPNLSPVERNVLVALDEIVKEWAPYLSAISGNKVKIISEKPSHPRNEENRIGAEVSNEILGKILAKPVAPAYYMYETAEWADKQMASICPYLVGQNPTGTMAGGKVGCGKLIIVNINGWNNRVAGVDGSWFESAHETFHVAQYIAAIVNNDSNNSAWYPNFPAWYREGSASTFGGLVRSLVSKGKFNYGDLSQIEKSSVSFNECNKAWKLWQESNNATDFADLGQCEYGLGRRMTDYLVARHGGVAGILKNYEFVAQGKSFEEAFKLAHGIALKDFFEEVKPFLATQGFVIP